MSSSIDQQLEEAKDNPSLAAKLLDQLYADQEELASRPEWQRPDLYNTLTNTVYDFLDQQNIPAQQTEQRNLQQTHLAITIINEVTIMFNNLAEASETLNSEQFAQEFYRLEKETEEHLNKLFSDQQQINPDFLQEQTPVEGVKPTPVSYLDNEEEEKKEENAVEDVELASASTTTPQPQPTTSILDKIRECLMALGLSTDGPISMKQISSVFRNQALQEHPDKHPKDKKEEQTEKFQQLSDAHDFLKSNPGMLEQFNQTFGSSASAGAATEAGAATGAGISTEQVATLALMA